MTRALTARRPVRLRRAMVRTLAATLAAAAWLPAAADQAASLPTDPRARRAALSRPPTDALDALTDPDELEGTARRQVILHPDRVEFLHGARSRGSLAFPGRDTSLPEIAELLARIDRSDWIGQTGPGEYLLRAALVQAPGTSLTIAAPAVREVRLAGAFLAGLGASARLQGVTLTSWDPATSTPERQPRRGRPFVFYGRGSRLDVTGAELAFLGSGRAKGEAGVTWSLAGGHITDTVFHHNHDGITLDRARPVVIDGSTFRANIRNGLAAAGPSRGLDVGGSTADDNGANGLLVRRKTVGATLHGNHASGNAANGIVLDQHADHAVVERNRVEGNTGDGVVLRVVSHTRLAGNTVSGNRVGVRIGVRSGGNVLDRNRVHRNQVGVELYDGAHDTRLTGNHVTDSGQVGMVLEAPRTSSRSDRVHGSPVGIEVRAPARLEATTIGGASTGVLVTEQGTAHLTAATVEAATVAVETRPGGVTRVRDSTLHAPTPLHGTVPRGQTGNQLSEPSSPTAWLALAGLACVVLAVALQILHRIRNGHQDLRHAGG